MSIDETLDIKRTLKLPIVNFKLYFAEFLSMKEKYAVGETTMFTFFFLIQCCYMYIVLYLIFEVGEQVFKDNNPTKQRNYVGTYVIYFNTKKYTFVPISH